MKVSTKHKDMARKLLAHPEDNGPRSGRRWRTTSIPVVEAQLHAEEYEPYLYEEAVTRARLSDEQINQLAFELKLDLSLEESWVTLEKMTMWM